MVEITIILSESEGAEDWALEWLDLPAFDPYATATIGERLRPCLVEILRRADAVLHQLVAPRSSALIGLKSKHDREHVRPPGLADLQLEIYIDTYFFNYKSFKIKKKKLQHNIPNLCI